MKKIYGIAISLLAGIIAFWIIFTQFSFREIIAHVQGAPLWAIIGYIDVIILIMITHSWRWYHILQAQGHNLPFWKVFWYKVIGNSVSYITPGAKVGGEAIRAGLLKKHNIPFHESMSGIVIDKILELSTYGFFFIIGGMVALNTHKLSLFMSLIFVIVTLWMFGFIGLFYYQMLKGKPFFCLLFRWLRLHKLKRIKKVEKKLEEFEALIHVFYKEHRAYLYRSLLISLGGWLLMFAEFKFITIILGLNVTFMQLFLIITFIGASFLLPIPMALGALEAGQISVFKMIKLSSTAGIAVALITRTKDLLWTLTGFIALGIMGIKLSDQFPKKK